MNILEALGFAVAHCALSPESFRALSPQEWEAIAFAAAQREDSAARRSWEQSRILAYSSVSPYLDKHTTLQQFLPLPWDELQANAEPVGLLTPEERAALLARNTPQSES